MPPVVTKRLTLVSIPISLMRDLAAGRSAATERRLRVKLPEHFAARARTLMQIRLRDVERDPGARPWFLRFIVLRAEPSSTSTGSETGARRIALGLIGFHGRPDAEGRAEIGYEVFAPHRRRGYASEAVTGLLGWATRRHGVRTFLAAIAPENEPSMRLARRLGFREIGAQVDEADGLELIYELRVAPARASRPSRL